MNYILLQKQEETLIFTESENQYPVITAQTLDEIQPFEIHENSTVFFDDMLLPKEESHFDPFFTKGRHNDIHKYYITQSFLHLPKNTIRNNSEIVIFFKQTQRNFILFFHDIAGLDMSPEEWKQFGRKAWENVYEYLQIDRFAKIGEGLYIIRTCIKTTYIDCTSETKPF